MPALEWQACMLLAWAPATVSQTDPGDLLYAAGASLLSSAPVLLSSKHSIPTNGHLISAGPEVL